MEKIKYILSRLTLLVAMLCTATACEEAEVDQTQGIDMSNEFSTLIFDGANDSEDDGKIVIITTSANWELSTSEEWIHLTQSGGTSGKGSFYVWVDANYESDTRYGTIEITSGIDRRTIIVEQLRYQYIDVASTSYAYDGREHSFSVVAATNIAAKNVEVSLSAEAAEWISCSSPTQTTIDGDEIQLKYTFYVTQLPDDVDERAADVTILYSKIGVGKSFSVSQSAYPTISIEELSQELDYYETTCSIDVVSNVDVVVEIPEGNSWITLNDDVAESGSTKTYSFTIEDNGDATEPRDCDIKLAYYAKNESTNISEEVVEFTKEVNIKQLGKEVAVSFVDEDKYTETQSYILNESFKVSLSSNVELTAAVVGDNSWVSIVGEPTAVDADEIEGNGDDKIYTFTLKLEQNDSTTDLRYETINFTNTLDDSKNTSIVITQDKEQPFITIASEESLSYDANDSFQIVVTANDAATPTVTIGDDIWISQIGVATQADTNITGVYDYTYTFDVDNNFYVGAQDRTSEITFAATSTSDSVTISQEARVPSVTINNESLVVATQLFNVGSVTISVTSDIELTEQISTTNSWTIEGVANDSGYEYIVTIPDNDETSVHTATVTLSNSEYSYSHDITITQEAMPSTYTFSSFVTGDLANSSIENPENYSRVVISGEALSADDFTKLTTSFTNMEYLDISATATTAIPDSQFKNFSMLKYIMLPSTLESIGYNSFYGSGLLAITIPASVKSWATDSTGYNDAFRATPLTSITFESGLKTMGCRTFYQCTSLTSIYIPASISEWSVSQTPTVSATNSTNQAFSGCSSLAYAELESGREEFPSSIFNSCSSPFTLVSHCDVPPTITCAGYQVIDGAYTGVRTYYAVNGGAINMAQIYVPDGCVEAYSLADGWKDQKLISKIE